MLLKKLLLTCLFIGAGVSSAYGYPPGQEAEGRRELAKYLDLHRSHLGVSDSALIYVCQDFALLKSDQSENWYLLGDLPESQFSRNSSDNTQWFAPPIVSLSLESSDQSQSLLEFKGKNQRQVWHSSLGMPAYSGSYSIFYKLSFDNRDQREFTVERRINPGTQALGISWQWTDLIYQPLFKGSCVESRFSEYLNGLENSDRTGSHSVR